MVLQSCCSVKDIIRPCFDPALLIEGSTSSSMLPYPFPRGTRHIQMVPVRSHPSGDNSKPIIPAIKKLFTSIHNSEDAVLF